MRYFITTFIALATLFSATNALAQTIDKAKLKAKIESMIPKSVNDTTPGLVIGVVHKGELIFSAGYGIANLSYGLPNDSKKLYNIGSVSKQFLGYAFAMIEVQGMVNLDDPVTKYLEDWPEFDQTVTIRHLLTHTSGYREAYTMSNLAGRIVGVDRLSKEECLDVVRKQPALEFAPGSKHTYNSTAWVILAEIFEEVTKEPADKWVTENILIPLGMTNTHIESYVGEVIPNAAESYTYTEETGYANQESNRAIFGAAEVYTNVEDMVRWITNLGSSELGGKDVTSRFLTPYQLTDGSDSHYALGMRIDEHRGLKRYSHNGGHEAFITQLSYYPEHDLGIFQVTNFGGKGWINNGEIATFLLEEHMKPKAATGEFKTIKLSKAKQEMFLGTYMNADLSDWITIKMVDDTLTTWGNEKLLPISKTTFGMKGWGGRFRFISAADGSSQLELQADDTTTYYLHESWAPSAKDLKAFEGDYWSKELETVYHLIVKDDQLTIQHRWLGELKLKPIAKDLFSSNWGFVFHIVRSDQGEIAGFNINSGRTLNVFFGRKG